MFNVLVGDEVSDNWFDLYEPWDYIEAYVKEAFPGGYKIEGWEIDPPVYLQTGLDLKDIHNMAQLLKMMEGVKKNAMAEHITYFGWHSGPVQSVMFFQKYVGSFHSMEEFAELVLELPFDLPKWLKVDGDNLYDEYIVCNDGHHLHVFNR